jgi:hypothetical protein
VGSAPENRRISDCAGPLRQEVKDYLRGILDAGIESVSTESPMGVISPAFSSPRQLLAFARTTVEVLESPEAVEARPEGIVSLGVIEWILRPSLPIKNGLIMPPSSPPWSWLVSDVVEDLSKAVCRVDVVVEGYESWQLGTRFCVGITAGDGAVIITNAHVVKAASRMGWRQIEGVDLACDFGRFSAEIGGHMLKLSKHCTPRLHPYYDLALLFIEAERVTTPIKPLAISDSAPVPTEGLPIGVIGHPSFDSARDPFPGYFGFGGEFGIKRFSPGYIRAMDSRFVGQQLEVVKRVRNGPVVAAHEPEPAYIDAGPDRDEQVCPELATRCKLGFGG